MTMEDERNLDLDLLVAELEQENERLERELNEALDANARFEVALEHLFTITLVVLVVVLLVLDLF